MGKFHFPKAHRFLRFINDNKGFTLIELLVVIIMLGILATLILMTMNPFTQIQKGQDAQRERDLKQLQSAMDTFYNDTNCYPALGSANVPVSGSHWTNSNNANTLYMQKVPEDPSVISGGQNYAYVTDSASQCPQWNVIFAKVANKYTSASTLCPLNNIMTDSDGTVDPNGTTKCVPKNYDPNNPNSRYNYCVLSGNVECKVIESLNMNDLNSVTALQVSSGNGGNGGSNCSCASAPFQLSNGHCNSHNPLDSLTGPGFCDSGCSPESACAP